jgi:outer membrane protein W
MIDKTDGNVLLSGPTMNLFFRYTNTTNITPFIGVGIGFYSGSFDPDPEWEYSSEYDGNAYNHMDVDNVLGLLFTTGAEWRVSKHWAIEFSAQYIKADVDATYNGYYYDVNYTTQEGHFPLSNIALRTGISYVF